MNHDQLALAVAAGDLGDQVRPSNTTGGRVGKELRIAELHRREVDLLGDAREEELHELTEELRQHFLPDLVVVHSASPTPVGSATAQCTPMGPRTRRHAGVRGVDVEQCARPRTPGAGVPKVGVNRAGNPPAPCGRIR
jgi:hypothetical protein